MARTGRPKTELVLTDDEHDQLTRWSRRAKSSQSLALRSRIVLACADGADNKTVAARVGCAAVTVGKWRARFVELRLDGLLDEPRSGRPPVVTLDQVEDVVVATLESTPANATHWSRTKMAERTGLSRSTIGRIWRTFELKPHRADGFKLSNDPLFVEKVYDVVGLYLNPPEAAVVLCVDEKTQVQALARSQPAFPMMPGMPEKRTHDYVRHGTTSLFAAFNTADGTVISSIHRRHRAVEFKKFLAKIDIEVPDDLEVHLIADNYAWGLACCAVHVGFYPPDGATGYGFQGSCVPGSPGWFRSVLSRQGVWTWMVSTVLGETCNSPPVWIRVARRSAGHPSWREVAACQA